MKKTAGILFVAAGLILLGCAGALTLSNVHRQEEAGAASAQVLAEFREKVETQNKTLSADAQPKAEQVVPAAMTDEQIGVKAAVQIDGEVYIGAVQIPSLELQLPVIGDWSYDNLEIAPCRYAGSVNSDDLVICGHNYNTHFGRLPELKIGDEIDFYTADGRLIRYAVGEIETLEPEDVEYMTDGEWPLTLFTCTWGGQSRIAVRCEKGINE